MHFTILAISQLVLDQVDFKSALLGFSSAADSCTGLSVSVATRRYPPRRTRAYETNGSPASEHEQLFLSLLRSRLCFYMCSKRSPCLRPLIGPYREAGKLPGDGRRGKGKGRRSPRSPRRAQSTKSVRSRLEQFAAPAHERPSPERSISLRIPRSSILAGRSFTLVGGDHGARTFVVNNSINRAPGTSGKKLMI